MAVGLDVGLEVAVGAEHGDKPLHVVDGVEVLERLLNFVAAAEISADRGVGPTAASEFLLLAGVFVVPEFASWKTKISRCLAEDLIPHCHEPP